MAGLPNLAPACEVLPAQSPVTGRYFLSRSAHCVSSGLPAKVAKMPSWATYERLRETMLNGAWVGSRRQDRQPLLARLELRLGRRAGVTGPRVAQGNGDACALPDRGPRAEYRASRATLSAPARSSMIAARLDDRKRNRRQRGAPEDTLGMLRILAAERAAGRRTSSLPRRGSAAPRRGIRRCVSRAAAASAGGARISRTDEFLAACTKALLQTHGPQANPLLLA